MDDLAQRLQAPFHAEDVEWRVNQSGIKNGKPWAKVLAYITNRAIMQRLDEVVGPGGWKNEYTTGPGGGVLCGLSLKIGDEWVTKWDGSENTQFEAVKGGLSGAMKRAAVQWGIGRYLYQLDEGWANFHPGGAHADRVRAHKQDDGQWFNWDPPKLPTWALPSEGEQRPDPRSSRPSSASRSSSSTTPRAASTDHTTSGDDGEGEHPFWDTLNKKWRAIWGQLLKEGAVEEALRYPVQSSLFSNPKGEPKVKSMKDLQGHERWCQRLLKGIDKRGTEVFMQTVQETHDLILGRVREGGA